jgi:hypothetical protein
MRSPFPYYALSPPRERFVPITNPEILEKINRAVQHVCKGCNTSGTCSMLRDRHNAQGRPLLECSVVKHAGITAKNCPECGGNLTEDSDYPKDLLCGHCNKVFDAATLEFVEAY